MFKCLEDTATTRGTEGETFYFPKHVRYRIEKVPQGVQIRTSKNDHACFDYIASRGETIILVKSFHDNYIPFTTVPRKESVRVAIQ